MSESDYEHEHERRKEYKKKKRSREHNYDRDSAEPEDVMYDNTNEIVFSNDQEAQVGHVVVDTSQTFDLNTQIEKIVDKKLSSMTDKITESIASYMNKSKRKRRHEVSSSSEEESVEERGRRRKHKRRRKYETESDTLSAEEDCEDERASDDGLFGEDDKAKGQPLKESTRKFLERRFKTKAVSKNFVAKVDKYKTPKNANFLRAQNTNTEILPTLRNYIKSRDRSLQIIQRNLSKATIATARAMDETGSNEKLEDSLTILAQTHIQIASVRKQLQRPQLSTVLKQAIDKTEAEEISDEWLYGEKLHKKIKEARENVRDDFLFQSHKRERPYTDKKYRTDKQYHQHQRRKPFKPYHQNQQGQGQKKFFGQSQGPKRK